MSILIGNETKKWRKCVPTLNAILGTHTMIYNSFVIKTFDTNEISGVHRLITIEKDTLDYEILQKVGGNKKEGQHQMIGNIYTHPFQEVYA